MGLGRVGRHVSLVVLLLVERWTHLIGHPSVLTLECFKNYWKRQRKKNHYTGIESQISEGIQGMFI